MTNLAFRTVEEDRVQLAIEGFWTSNAVIAPSPEGPARRASKEEASLRLSKGSARVQENPGGAPSAGRKASARARAEGGRQGEVQVDQGEDGHCGEEEESQRPAEARRPDGSLVGEDRASNQEGVDGRA